jgi:hypothetical protein
MIAIFDEECVTPSSRRCVFGGMLTGWREISSGGGTVDFQEFVSGLSAFSSRGGREEKLHCAYPAYPVPLILNGGPSPLTNLILRTVAFKVYDMDRDGYISNGELFLVLKMMVGNNLKVRRLGVVTFRIGIDSCAVRMRNCNRLSIRRLWRLIRTGTYLFRCLPISSIETDGSHSDGKLSFEEFSAMVSNTVRSSRALISWYRPSLYLGHRETNDPGRSLLVLLQHARSLVDCTPNHRAYLVSHIHKPNLDFPCTKQIQIPLPLCEDS